MKKKNLRKAALLMIVVVVAVIGGWEIYLRQKGLAPDFDDGAPLWADRRQRVYDDNAVVFIGSSRIAYDLDPEIWEKETGTEAVQLALAGHSPLPFLRDLGNDPNFHGKLVIDVTEVLYFSPVPAYSAEAQENVDYYHHLTLAQRLSFQLDKPLESSFVFLNKDKLSLNAELNRLNIPPRPGVYGAPDFPIEFQSATDRRQIKMMPKFLTDTNLQRQVTGVWEFFLNATLHVPHQPANADTAAPVIAETRQLVGKIRARGGEVVFIRCPSSGKFLELEATLVPREKFWAPLVRASGCQSFYFADYPGLSKFKPVEWSHLSPADAKGFTHELIRVLPASFTQSPHQKS